MVYACLSKQLESLNKTVEVQASLDIKLLEFTQIAGYVLYALY